MVIELLDDQELYCYDCQRAANTECVELKHKTEMVNADKNLGDAVVDQKTEHSPLPWSDTGMHIKDARGLAIASVLSPLGKFSNEEIDANGALIIEAANNHHKYKAALEAITKIAGNLTDEAVEGVGGVNDARSRALMVVTARQIAKTALSPQSQDNKESK